MIAWLHLLQPLARARGRLRGILTSPEFELAQEHAVPAPAWHQIADVLSFFTTRRPALTFWSESWLAREGLLTGIVERMRSTRVATALEVDGPWQLARDVSVQLGRWGLLDVQLLVEEHERGSVLVRIARRLRVTPFFAMSITSLVTLVTLMASVDDGWVFVAPVLVVMAVMARAAWDAAATVALTDQVVVRALQDAGAHPLSAQRAEAWPVASAPEPAGSATVEHAG